MKVLERAPTLGLTVTTSVTARQALIIGLLVSLLALALFTRLWRLGTPDVLYFDETQVVPTAQAILNGDPAAWVFIGQENTHPPLAKLLVAGGMAVFGEDNSFGWRFLGALAGVGSVVFIYLLGKRLFGSEIAAMAAAFLMVFEGLSFAQARIATPDTYLLFFVLGAVYFLVSDRFMLSGVFFGAALATKLSALLTVFPIVIYLLYRHWRADQGEGSRLLYLAPVTLLAFYLGTPVLFGGLLVDKLDTGALVPDVSAQAFSAALGSWMAFWALAPLAAYLIYVYASRSRKGRDENAAAGLLIVLPLFFVLVPLSIYLLTYVPMLFTGHSLEDVLMLNRNGYQFHAASPLVAGPEASHPYSSPWNTWPIMMRPVFFFLEGSTKIYSLGNPIIFWLGLPALGIILWRGIKGLRVTLNKATEGFSIVGSLDREQAVLLFVVLVYLGFLLPWAMQLRITFIYHYLPSLAFLLLALGYLVHKLWQRPWGRSVAIVFLAAAALTFVYFYPNLAAVDVPSDWVGFRVNEDGVNITRGAESFFWFDSWR